MVSKQLRPLTSRPDRRHRTLIDAAIAGLVLLGCSDRATLGSLCSDACTADVQADTAEPGSNQRFPPPGNTHDGGVWHTDAGLRCDSVPQAVPVRALNVLLLVDDDITGTPWWPAYREGIAGFLRSPAAAGLGAGLMRARESCSSLAYQALTVPVATLPDNAAAIMAEVPLAPIGNNSFIPALAGVLSTAREWARQHEGAQVLVLVLTDGSPGPCDGAFVDYPGEAGALLAAAQVGVPPVATHVVGFGALGALTGLALEPNTPLQLLGSTPTPAFSTAALRTAVESTGTCTLAIPAGSAVDPDRHEILVVQDQETTPFQILQDQGMCEGNGLYLAPDAAPSRLMACPGTCAALTTADSVTASGLCREP